MPPEGSVVERVLMSVLEREQKAKVLSTKAIIHAALGDAETAMTVFEEYTGLLIPYMEALKEEEKENLRKQVEAISNQVVVISPSALASLEKHAMKEGAP